VSLELFKKLFAKKDEPLRGVPTVRRQKNYSAESGYAYEYFHEGWRPSAGTLEYRFTVSGDRKTWFPLSVFVDEAAVRTLKDNERYAVAKMALFTAFDERESPAVMRDPVRVPAARVAEMLSRLGLA